MKSEQTQNYKSSFVKSVHFQKGSLTINCEKFVNIQPKDMLEWQIASHGPITCNIIYDFSQAPKLHTVWLFACN